MTRHIITGEYSPDHGGVADYTRTVAEALAASGEQVHVWCGGALGAVPSAAAGVVVHRDFGRFDREGLTRADAELGRQPAPRHLLVQWVPHAYGRASMNIGFCRWVRRRARAHGDRVEVMIHEPFLPFEGSVRQRAAAMVHRIMIRVLLGSASRVWVAVPEWTTLCRPFAPRMPFGWLPIPSGIDAHAHGPSGQRSGRAATADEPFVIGSFGRTGKRQAHAIARVLDALRSRGVPARAVAIGAGSEELRDRVLALSPAAAIQCTGILGAAELSAALRGCDIALQPYDDGVCGRRSGVMACLAHGIPVVTIDGRFTEPAWRDGGVRLVTREDDLAAAVLELSGDVQARARLAADALALYDRHFDVRHTVAALQRQLAAAL